MEKNQTSIQIATQFRQFYFGKNWAASSLKEVLADVTLSQATQSIHDLNSILVLVYHLHYYVAGVLVVLKGGELTIRDKYSFDAPDIKNEQEWQQFLENIWKEGEEFASSIEKLSGKTLWDVFTDTKYGLYYRNLHGIIEHGHYHLGQIALIKKMIKSEK